MLFIEDKVDNIEKDLEKVSDDLYDFKSDISSDIFSLIMYLKSKYPDDSDLDGILKSSLLNI